MGTIVSPDELTVNYIVLMIAIPLLFNTRVFFVNGLTLLSMVTRKIFREGLSWCFQYKVDKEAEYYHLSLQEAQYAAENTMISAAFGTADGYGDNENVMQSVCAGYGAYNGKSVYFAVSVESDPLLSVVPVVFGDAVAYRVNNVFLQNGGGDARQSEYYRKSMSFDISNAGYR